ncbi:MAG: GNAT family N-acetyltransferase [Pseudomonadota bacterium]
MNRKQTDAEDVERGVGFAAPLLMTKRLLLAVPSPREAKGIAAIADNPRVAAMLATMPHPYSVDDALTWIARCRDDREDGNGFAIYLRDRPDAVIGACGFGRSDGEETPELGYWLGEPYWGRGFATEAAQAVVDFAFETSCFDAIACACRVTNPASRRVIEKCGFQYRDASMFHSLGAGGRVAAERYVLERKTWLGLKAWARPDAAPPAGAVTGEEANHGLA